MTFTLSGHTGSQEGRGREAVSRRPAAGPLQGQQSRQWPHSPGAPGAAQGRGLGAGGAAWTLCLEASLSTGVRVSRGRCMAATSRLPRGAFTHRSRQSRATLPSRGPFLLLLNH